MGEPALQDNIKTPKLRLCGVGVLYFTRQFEKVVRMRRRNRGMSAYSARQPRRMIWKVLLVVLLLLIVIVGWGAWKVLTPYKADDTALTAISSAAEAQVKVTETEQWIDFMPEEGAGKGTGVIFYPGGLVDPTSYAPLAKSLAEQGHHTVIVKMRFNLAFMEPDAASAVLAAYPDESFVIGGHSLGGAMAARYAATHSGQIQGLFLLASYADSKADLHTTSLPVLSILGTQDEVVNREKYQSGRANLPESTLYYTVEGGNHAQYGSYGPQKGDGVATITPEEQESRTVQVIIDWLTATVNVDKSSK